MRGGSTVEDRQAALRRGARAESFVAAWYARHGWRVVARNVRIGGGELDLVVRRQGELRFVEVKGRRPGDRLGFERITRGKRARLVRAARAWLADHGDGVDEAGFDVVLVAFGPRGMLLDRLEHAFDATR